MCSFLFLGNLIPKISTNASLKFIESSRKPALDLTALFLKQLNKQFDIQTDATYYPLLRKELNRIHYKFLKFNHSDLMIYFQANPEFLKENYPDFFYSQNPLFKLILNQLKKQQFYFMIIYFP